MNSFNILASLRNATSEVAENIINSCSSDDATLYMRCFYNQVFRKDNPDEYTPDIYNQVVDVLILNGLMLMYVENQTDELCLIAVKNIDTAIQYVKNKTPLLCSIAIAANPNNYIFITGKNFNLLRNVAFSIPGVIKEITNSCEELDYDTIKQIIEAKPEAILYVVEQTEELCNIAIKKSEGSALKHIKNQTEKMIMNAIEYDSFNIRYATILNEDIYTAAVTKNPYAIQCIKYPSEKVIQIAIEKEPLVIKYISDPSFDICLNVVKKNNNAIAFVPENINLKF